MHGPLTHGYCRHVNELEKSVSKLSLICEFAKLSIDNLDTLRFRLVLVAMNLVTSAGVLLWEYKKYSRDGFFGGEDADLDPEGSAQPEVVAAANASAAGGGGAGDESISLWLAFGGGLLAVLTMLACRGEGATPGDHAYNAAF